MSTIRATIAVFVAFASLTLGVGCTGPNPKSCIPMPSTCGAGKTCDMNTGECTIADAGRAETADAADAGDATEGGEAPAVDGAADADRPADDVAGDASVDLKDAPPDLATNGATCSSPSSCASAHCVDGVCCDTTCAATCTSCTLAASKGTCSPVKNADDPDSCPVAMNKTCDAKGACAAKNGESCGKGGDCVSGNCADGVCCNTACKDACSSCVLSGSKGTCAPVKNGDDPDSCAPATSTCDASGACKFKNALPCPGGPVDCASGNCADGVCCNTGCTGSCLSCAVSGSVGMCAPVKGGDDLDTCSGSYTCSPAGACRLKDTQPCTTNDNCASSVCGRFYKDADGDGYGDGTMSATFCTSAPVASPAWVVRGDDCCDKDAKVHPGQMEYQLYESTACGTTFDYDCNGKEDREYPSTNSCVTAGDGTCDPVSHDGWSGVVPACGKYGNLAHCGQSTCGPISCCVVTSTDMDYPARCR